MPNASIGPVITHVRVFSVVPSSREIRGSATANTVKVTLTEKSPARTVQSTHQR